MQSVIDIIKWLFASFLETLKPSDIFLGATDIPDTRDFVDGLPNIRHVPNYVNLLEVARQEYFRQTGTKLTFKVQSKNSCTAYSIGIYKTLLNLCKNGQIISFNEESQWRNQEKEQGATRASGGTLQGACKVALKYPQGYPLAEYRRIREKTIDHVIKRLAMGTPIYTGVTWKRTPDGKSNTYAQMLITGAWSWFKTVVLGGHAVVIYGVDKERQVFLVVEPMWKLWGKREVGTFEVPFSELENIMSMYVFLDLRDF